MRSRSTRALRSSIVQVEALERRSLMSVSVPSGVKSTVLVQGLDSPTAIATAPDGRIFIAEQDGLVRVVQHGKLQPARFMHLRVDSLVERGLLGITLDPNFSTNHFLYVYYNAPDARHPHNVVSRFTADGNTYLRGSERVLLSTPIFNPGEQSEQGGGIGFGADGKLYIGIGDHEDGTQAQTLDNPFGKILRINADGTIPTDNPFFNSTSGINRAIWAYGLRNPYKIAFQPASSKSPTGKLFINDVGGDLFEEIDQGLSGADYGWPQSEGPTTNTGFTTPVYSYAHGTGALQGGAITGGAFYNPSKPALASKYAGQYFFADLEAGWIHTIDAANPGTAQTFASGFDMPVDLQTGADGALYVLSHGNGPATATLTKIT